MGGEVPATEEALEGAADGAAAPAEAKRKKAEQPAGEATGDAEPKAKKGKQKKGKHEAPPPPKLQVKQMVLTKAIRALTQALAKRTANPNPLFEDMGEDLTLVFTLTTMEERRPRLKPWMIPLPHPLNDDKAEICLFAKSDHKEYKELLLKTYPYPGLTKVISLEKLRRNYNYLEAKRALADAFDVFLCDERILSAMPEALTKVFFRNKKKLPIPVRLELGKDPTPELEKAVKGTPMRMGKGSTTGVRFGRRGMEEEHLVQNASAVIAGVVQVFARQKLVLQRINVHATEAPSLPVWRRPQTPGELLDLRKYHSDASSVASETGNSRGASETEPSTDAAISEAAETLSVRATTASETAGDSASEVGTAGETLSEISSEMGDDNDDKPIPKEGLPLMQGLGKKKRKRQAEPAATTAAAAATKAKDSMPPPAPPKKAKRGREEKAEA